MSDRLKELQRQRALAQEQVAWLDREIAKERSLQPSPVPLAATPTETLKPGPVTPTESASTLDPESLIKRYQQDGRSVQQDVRRGCFTYFFAAFGVLIVALVIAYFIWRNLRGDAL